MIGAGLLLLSIVATRASGRIGLPALLLFLVIGMLAGSDGPGGIPFEDAGLTRSVGTVALLFILFSGGLDTQWQRVRPALGASLALATVGVAVTAAITGGLAAMILDLGVYEGLLLGSILASTDAAAVFSILRGRGIALTGRLREVLELESGTNDPMAVLLTMALIGVLTTAGVTAGDLTFFFLRQMIFGFGGGLLWGRLAIWCINRIRLGYEGLYPALTISFALLSFTTVTAIGGSGYLAVYLTGLVMGQRDFVHRRSLLRFHDGLSWLMQITVFLILGLLVFPKQLALVAAAGLATAFVLIFIARPIAVFIALAFSRLDLKDKTFISWVGIRGAVPIILATFPVEAGIPHADVIFNIVFFAVLVSILVQGLTMAPLARLLRVLAAPAEREPIDWADSAAGDTNKDLVTIVVTEESPIAGKPLVDVGLPPETLIVLLIRDDRYLIPSGQTVFEAGDALLVLCSRQSLQRLNALIGGV